jgi:hypothetical protein
MSGPGTQVDDEGQRGVSTRLLGLRFMQRAEERRKQQSPTKTPTEAAPLSTPLGQDKRASSKLKPLSKEEMKPMTVVLDCEHSVMAEDLSLSKYTTARRCYGMALSTSTAVGATPFPQSDVETVAQPALFGYAAAREARSPQEAEHLMLLPMRRDRPAISSRAQKELQFEKDQTYRSIHRPCPTKGSSFKSLSPIRRSTTPLKTKKTTPQRGLGRPHESMQE